jgi:hypothetical protein
MKHKPEPEAHTEDQPTPGPTPEERLAALEKAVAHINERLAALGFPVATDG